jgi:hypothetical protein
LAPRQAISIGGFCLGSFLATVKKIFYTGVMAGARVFPKSPPKMMLGFIVRRCAADLGHQPTPHEFAAWANEQGHNGRRYCLFGKPISPSVAKIMFSQPGRMVTVRPEGFAQNGKDYDR